MSENIKEAFEHTMEAIKLLSLRIDELENFVLTLVSEMGLKAEYRKYKGEKLGCGKQWIKPYGFVKCGDRGIGNRIILCDDCGRRE